VGCTSTGIAAEICYNLVLNGYSDWYLPSKDELNLMYFSLKMQGFGSFASNYNWCSSELSNYNAYDQSFTNGFQNNSPKLITCNVRAIRTFSVPPQFVCGTSNVTDYDGNIYNTVGISAQCWIQQNLKAIHYSNGTAVVYSPSGWLP
jgi:hypothetical protein